MIKGVCLSLLVLTGAAVPKPVPARSRQTLVQNNVPEVAIARARGVYVTSPNINDKGWRGDASSLISTAASGVFIRASWNIIEPSPNHFDWSAVDQIVKPAVQAHKKLSIGIIAGTYAPAWLGNSMGARFSNFTIAQHGCRIARIYWPWDAVYQKAYLAMMVGLKRHLKQIEALDSLRIVKISYIAQQTLELRLPRRTAGNYRGCQLEDETSTWRAAGYRPMLVVLAYRHILYELANKIFPDKLLSQPIQKGNSFPEISGEDKPLAEQELVQRLTEICVEVASSRCAVQNQSLQLLGPIGDAVIAAGRRGATLGWQTALNRGPCQMPASSEGVRASRKACATYSLHGR